MDARLHPPPACASRTSSRATPCGSSTTARWCAESRTRSSGWNGNVSPSIPSSASRYRRTCASLRRRSRRQAGQLHDRERRAQLVEAVVETGLDYVVRARMTLCRCHVSVVIPCERSRRADLRSRRRGDDHPAFADGQVLVREEAEAADGAERAEGTSLPARAGRMGRILDDRYPVTVATSPTASRSHAKPA